MADTFVPQFIIDQYKRGNMEGYFQAATLFVDLSGYTPLTEALMQHHKDGAEALAEALRSVFLPLINHVYARGGLIPLFAGDGFTAIFRCSEQNSNAADRHQGMSEAKRIDPPPTHPAKFHAAQLSAAAQATDCALAIQRWLHGDGGSVQTKYGTFPMAATTGLSFGMVGWGTPGRGSARAFYFRGEAVDGCAVAENLAMDGEILADEKIMPLLKGRYRLQSRVDNMWRVYENRSTPLSFRRRPKRPASVRSQLGDQNRSAPSAPTVADDGSSASSQISKETPSSPFIPESILNLAVRAEFREVCVLFLSFQEPDDLSEMHDFLAEVILLTRQFGGLVNQLDFGDMGGYLLLLFGAPITHENDVERAAELLMLLRDQGWSIPWRAGLDYGTVWTGIRGGDDRAEYGAAGNVVIMACRLFLKAPWDEIWLSKDMATALGEHYIMDSLGDIPIKGRSMIQPVFRLLKSQRDATQESLYPAGIVEREDELRALLEWGKALEKDQSPGMLLLHGEAGIGKSRLVREWRKRVEAQGPILWLSLPGDSTAQRSLNPIRRAMQRYYTYRGGQPLTRDHQYNRRLFERMEDTLVEELTGTGASANELIDDLLHGSSFLASLLDIYWDDSLYEKVEPKLRFENLISAFKALVMAESRLQPVILQLEDLHHYDDESIQFIQGLTPNIAACPIGFVGASRLAEDGSAFTLHVDDGIPLREIPLSYLSRGGVRHYASQVVQGEITDDVVTLLMEKTNGNPFFVEQLALTLLEQGVIEPTQGAASRGAASQGAASRGAASLGPRRGQMPKQSARYGLNVAKTLTIPATLNAVMTARLDRLEPAVKAVVQTAAVIGPQFEVGVLSRMMPEEPALFTLVRQAQLAQIWKPVDDGAQYQFQHALLRDAAYEMQLSSRLQKMHQQAAFAIQQQHMANLKPYYGTLASHYDHAAQTKSAIHWYSLAGEDAVKNFANADAIQYISRGLALTASGQRDERIKLTKLRATVYDIQGDRVNQEKDLQAVEAMGLDGGDQWLCAEVTVEMGHLARMTNDYEKALELFREAVRQAALEGYTDIELRGQYGIGRTLWQKGSYPQALTHLQTAQALARQQNDAKQEGQSLYDVGVIHYYEGRYETATKSFQEAQAVFHLYGDSRGEGNCLGMFGVVLNKQGDYLGAQDYYLKALALYQSIGYRHGQSFILGYLGNNYFDLGYYQQAAQYHLKALHQCREVADREGQSVSLNTLGLIELFEGDYVAARPLIEEAVTIQRSIGHRRGESYSLTYLGYIDTALNVYESAKIAHIEAIRLREKLNAHALIVDNWAGLAEVALAQSDLEPAVEHAQKILAWLGENGANGIEFPIQAYLTCFRVLSEASQLDSAYLSLAQATLSQGEALLRERADAILDDELRAQFYEAVPANRALQQSAEQWANSGIAE